MKTGSLVGSLAMTALSVALYPPLIFAMLLGLVALAALVRDPQ